MSEENPIDENNYDTNAPDALHHINLEHKISAGIVVLLFVLYGIAYFFQPEPKKVWESFPKNVSGTEGEGDGELREVTTYGIYYVGPTPL